MEVEEEAGEGEGEGEFSLSPFDIPFSNARDEMGTSVGRRPFYVRHGPVQ